MRATRMVPHLMLLCAALILLNHQFAGPSSKAVCKEPSYQERFNNSRIAVTVLHQPHPGLSFTLDNMVLNLPTEWRIQVFITPEMVSDVLQTPRIRRHIDSGKVFLTPTIDSTMSYSDYSLLLWTEQFWKQIQGEHVLIFQTDSVMCGNAPRSVNDYLEWDWIGAWHGEDQVMITQYAPPKGRSYNGGFSLRKKEKTLQMIRHCRKDLRKYQAKEFEDIWFEICYHGMLHDRLITLRLPPEDVAHSFSVQNYFVPKKKHLPLAAHKPWPYIEDAPLRAFAQHCPELCEILPKDRVMAICFPEKRDKKKMTTANN